MKDLSKVNKWMSIFLVAILVVVIEILLVSLFSKLNNMREVKTDLLLENSRLAGELQKEQEANAIMEERLIFSDYDNLVLKGRLNRSENSESQLQTRVRLLEDRIDAVIDAESSMEDVKSKSVVRKDIKNRLERVIERFKRVEQRNKEILEESRVKQKNIKLEQKRKFYVGLWRDYYQEKSFKPVGFQLADSALKDLFESNPQLLDLRKYKYDKRLISHFNFFHKIDFYYYYPITEYYFLDLVQSVQSSVPRKADKDFAVLLGIALENQWLVDDLEVKLEEVTSIAGNSIEGGSLYETCKDIDYLKKYAEPIPKDVLIGDILGKNEIAKK